MYTSRDVLVYVFAHIYTYICIHTFTYTYMFMCAYVFMCMYVYRYSLSQLKVAACLNSRLFLEGVLPKPSNLSDCS